MKGSCNFDRNHKKITDPVKLHQKGSVDLFSPSEDVRANITGKDVLLKNQTEKLHFFQHHLRDQMANKCLGDDSAAELKYGGGWQSRGMIQQSETAEQRMLNQEQAAEQRLLKQKFLKIHLLEDHLEL